MITIKYILETHIRIGIGYVPKDHGEILTKVSCVFPMSFLRFLSVLSSQSIQEAAQQMS
jgi:hypothetical protein